MKTDPIIIEHTFEVPVDTIWRALTDRNEMKKWYFDLASFEPVVGFKFQFYGGEEGGKQYLHLCEIQEVIPQKKIAYSWKYDGYNGNSLVTFQLIADGDKTKVRLTHEGVHTFPNDNRDLAKENFVAGWTDIVNNSLKRYLETE